MKNRLALLTLLLVFGVFLGGCATALPAGAFYTEVAFPGAVGDGSLNYSKVGKAMSTSYFALIATGDASIQAAAKNGGITDIKYVDYNVKNILGFIGEYTTTVYGN